MTENPEVLTRILAVLMNHPAGLNILEIAELTGLNRMSVAKYLDVLTAQETVEVRMFGRSKVYCFAGRRLPVAAFREHLPLHYVITDSTLTVTQLNDYVPRTVGKVGISLPEMFQGHVANYDECMVAFEAALAGNPSTVTAERLFPEGSRFCELFCMPVRFPDGSPGMLSLSVDITRERLRGIAARAEADQYRTLLDGLAYPVFQAGTDGVLTYLSPRAAELGLAPGAFTGRPVSDIAVPDDRETVAASLRAVRKYGKGTFRFRFSGPDGVTPLVEAVCTIQRDAAGTFTGIAGLLREVPGDTCLPGKQEPGREG
jgi:PAS domain S-box-containing protein